MYQTHTLPTMKIPQSERRHFPFSVDFGCKGTTFLSDMQIFRNKNVFYLHPSPRKSRQAFLTGLRSGEQKVRRRNCLTLNKYPPKTKGATALAAPLLEMKSGCKGYLIRTPAALYSIPLRLITSCPSRRIFTVGKVSPFTWSIAVSGLPSMTKLYCTPVPHSMEPVSL